ncbi:unnamed protein product [Periconia digitata]|uniref:Rhodopsin domain-containing protein n=1 Tax=Periconia digitata TaxID=1303443 RepID=A0A9W4U5R5_9PLEO|nr:unnamed protein product [Periconia digitata]
MSVNPAGACILGIFMPVIATSVVGARFYARHYKNAKLGGDDWTSLAGLVGLWAVSGLVLDGARKGLIGGHSKMNPVTGAMIQTNESPNVRYAWMIISITTPTLMITKLSVLLLYRRIFAVSETFRWYRIALIVLLVIWGVGFTFAKIFQCGTHPTAFWTNKYTFLRYCSDPGGLNVAMCLSDVIFDLMILAAPVPMIWKLHISTFRKIQVCGVFALGFLSTAAAVVRTYIVSFTAYGTKLGFRDVMEENTKIAIWCMIEIASALIGCCLPTLKSLVNGQSLASIVHSIRSKLVSWSNTKRNESDAEEGLADVHGLDAKEYMDLAVKH